MPNYVQVQTYATCTRANFSTVLLRYRQTMQQLGCSDQQVLTWLSQLTWPEGDDDYFGDIYAAPVQLSPTNADPIECDSIDIVLYPNIAVPSIDKPPVWIGFNLVFETTPLQTEVDGLPGPYPASVAHTFWQILQTISTSFFELGVYFTDEWQENLAWRAIVEQTGEPWNFDLGLFPRHLARFFEDIPAGYQGTVVDGGFGFAQINRWQSLPWLAATTHKVNTN